MGLVTLSPPQQVKDPVNRLVNSQCEVNYNCLNSLVIVVAQCHLYYVWGWWQVAITLG